MTSNYAFNPPIGSGTAACYKHSHIIYTQKIQYHFTVKHELTCIAHIFVHVTYTLAHIPTNLADWAITCNAFNKCTSTLPQ